nr:MULTISPECIES: patatin-like phospholipase family protein [unclassified Vibrio]
MIPNPKLLVIVLLVLLVSGCAQTPERSILLNSEQLNPLDTPGLRFWDESIISADNYDFNHAIESLVDYSHKSGQVNHLALSGGGFNGAFSAGVLNAWSESGTRPEFDVVTGVSTGAIVSVFAFLGSDYDQALEFYYTRTTAEEMFKRNSILKLPFRNSMVDVSGFEDKVRNAVDATMVKQLAFERSKGRLLLIATTSLDNEKMAIWDVGKIAHIGSPQAQQLIQDIIIASSAVPGLFPATRISLPYKGGTVDELHVDGGVSRQVFLIPQGFQKTFIPRNIEKNIYVIRNGYLKPEFEEVDNGLASVSYRALSILIRRQSIGDIEHIYHYSDRNQIGFHLAYIDDDFSKDNLNSFSLEYMQKLYAYGYNKKMESDLWSQSLPNPD